MGFFELESEVDQFHEFFTHRFHITIFGERYLKWILSGFLIFLVESILSHHFPVS